MHQANRPEIYVPTVGSVYGVAFSSDLIGFSSGRTACTFGKGGNIFASWKDQPSYETVVGFLRVMMSNGEGDEQQLGQIMQLLLDRHPALANVCHLETQTSLLEHVIRKTNNAQASAHMPHLHFERLL
jgi:hypothetical protein